MAASDDSSTANHSATRGPPTGNGSLPPSNGPTQVGTTLTLAFRVIIGADGEEEMEEFGGFQYTEIVASDQDVLPGATEETIPQKGGVIESLVGERIYSRKYSDS